LYSGSTIPTEADVVASNVSALMLTSTVDACVAPAEQNQAYLLRYTQLRVVVNVSLKAGQLGGNLVGSRL
jgi:hypothetical protein